MALRRAAGQDGPAEKLTQGLCCRVPAVQRHTAFPLLPGLAGKNLFSTLGAPAFFRRPGRAASMDLRAAGAESCRPRIRAACPAQKALRVSREGRGNRAFASSAPAGGRHVEGTKSVDGCSLPVKNASAVVSCRLR